MVLTRCGGESSEMETHFVWRPGAAASARFIVQLIGLIQGLGAPQLSQPKERTDVRQDGIGEVEYCLKWAESKTAEAEGPGKPLSAGQGRRDASATELPMGPVRGIRR